MPFPVDYPNCPISCGLQSTAPHYITLVLTFRFCEPALRNLPLQGAFFSNSLQPRELHGGNRMKFLYTMFVALLVAGCGGGGSDDSAPAGGNGGSGGGGSGGGGSGGGGSGGDGSGGDGSGGGGDDPSGGSGSDDTPNPESAAGVWTGSDSTGYISLSCLVTSTQRIGCRYLDRRDNSVSGALGQLHPTGDTFTGSGELFTGSGQAELTGIGVAFSGSFVNGETLYLTASSLDESDTFTLQYDHDRGYETPSSLEIVSGQYEGEDVLTGNALEIDITNDGTIVTRTSSQTGSHICNGSGYIHPIDPLFSEYVVSSLYVTCTGAAPVTLEGVATLSTYDASSFFDVAIAAPDTMVIGSSELVRSW